MIEITDKKDCTGCNACTQRCPVHCITMREDSEGFLYPVVDAEVCIKCGLCERVCPVINPGTPRTPLAAYAATNPDREVLMNSSSGGMFHAFANHFISRGGAVFGARFTPDWEVEHACARTMAEAKAFMGSKYVQSRIGDTFSQAEQLLKAGVPVLFTGTPCQIAGLNLFLRKSYSPLLVTAEVACHGVPSPRLWREYVQAHESTVNQTITAISFRSKEISWEDFGLRIAYTGGKAYFNTMWRDDYMTAFLRNMTLRPSCYYCPAKKGASHADITLGDYWGVANTDPAAYNPDGTSFVLANTPAAEALLSQISPGLKPTGYNEIVQHNSALVRSVALPPGRDAFMKSFESGGIAQFNQMVKKLRPSIAARIMSRLRRIAASALHLLSRR